MDTDTFDIQELVRASGVPRRTVYFYVQQGLLPPPEGAGLAAHYSTQHLMRLRLIPLLRRQGLRLDEIRQRFATLSSEEMQRLLDAAPEPLEEPVPLSLVAETKPAYADTYVHYRLPLGMTLLVPAELAQREHERLGQLQQLAAQLFAPNIRLIAVQPGQDNHSSSTDQA